MRHFLGVFRPGKTSRGILEEFCIVGDCGFSVFVLLIDRFCGEP
jgi:hypothetical protein